MDMDMRIIICRLLEFAEQDPSFSERIGIRDVSFYKDSPDSSDESSDGMNRSVKGYGGFNYG